LFIIGHHGEDFSKILLSKSNDNIEVIDLVRLKDAAIEERAAYQGVCW
jgi:hypothetical protein